MSRSPQAEWLARYAGAEGWNRSLLGLRFHELLEDQLQAELDLAGSSGGGNRGP